MEFEKLYWTDVQETVLRSTTVETMCKQCGMNDSFISDSECVGQSVCICGSICKDILNIDMKPKYKGNTKDDDMIKDECVDAFIDPTLPKSSISVVMSHGGSSLFQSLRRLQNGYMSSDERSVLSIMDIIRHQTDGHGYPTSIFHDAAVLFRKLQDRSREMKDCTRGDIRKALIAACVFYSCRTVGVVKTQEEVARSFGLTEEQFTKGWARFIDICTHRGFSQLSLPPLLPRDFIFRLSHALSIPWSITQFILVISDIVRDHQLCSSNTPSSLAGAIVLSVIQMYQQSHHYISQYAKSVSTMDWEMAIRRIQVDVVAQTCGMSVMTLTKITKDLMTHFEYLTRSTSSMVTLVELSTVSTDPSRRNLKKKRRLDGIPSLSSAVVATM